MKFSIKTKYALDMLLYLSQHNDGGWVSLKEVASALQLSRKYLEQVAALLSRSVLVDAVRGTNGGYRLAKPWEEYSIGDVLYVTEPRLFGNSPKPENVTPADQLSDQFGTSMENLFRQTKLIDLYEKTAG